MTAEYERKVIENAFSEKYEGQKDVKKFSPSLKNKLGGKDALTCIYVYDGDSYWHFVSYGLCAHKKKFGYEMSFKLKKDGVKDEEAEFNNICETLQAIAKEVEKENVILNKYTIISNDDGSIDFSKKSKLTGFLTAPDSTVVHIDTKYGPINYLCLVGITEDEMEAFKEKKIIVSSLFKTIGSDITDYSRGSVFEVGLVKDSSLRYPHGITENQIDELMELFKPHYVKGRDVKSIRNDKLVDAIKEWYSSDDKDNAVRQEKYTAELNCLIGDVVLLGIANKGKNARIDNVAFSTPIDEFLIVFTDLDEVEKFVRVEKSYSGVSLLPIEKIFDMVFKSDYFSGIMINPCSDNLRTVVLRADLALVFQQQLAYRRDQNKV